MGIIAVVLGIIIWLFFNSCVTRWYFGANLVSIICSIIGEIIVCIFIAGAILTFLGSALVGILGFIGGIFLFVLKIVIILAIISAVVGLIYYIYAKIKGANIDASSMKVKAQEAKSRLFQRKNRIPHNLSFDSDNTISNCSNSAPATTNNAFNAPDNSKSQHNTENDQPVLIKIIHCKYCGNAMSSLNNFCDKCGNKNDIH